MRPMKELLGKTIAEMPVEVLYDEIGERTAIHNAIGEEKLREMFFNGDVSDAHREIITLWSEVDRLMMMPDSQSWRNEYDLGFWEFIEAGMEIQRKMGSVKQRESKLFAIEHAAELFKSDPTVLQIDVVRSFRVELEKRGMSLPRSERCGKDWLQEAEKKGLLDIPESAKEGGAPAR